MLQPCHLQEKVGNYHLSRIRQGLFSNAVEYITTEVLSYQQVFLFGCADFMVALQFGIFKDIEHNNIEREVTRALPSR
jgi:hypothetical protein